MKNTFVLTGLAIVIVGMGFITVTQASAADENPQDNLVSKIATKFNLNKADVQAVFDEHHSEMHTKMQERYEAYLTQLVTEGKITEAQKTLLINKHKELASEMASHKDVLNDQSPVERKKTMDAKRTELEAWAKENGIDLQYLRGPMGRGVRGHGFGKSLY